MADHGIDIRKLLEFAPEMGVLSVYVDLDPGDRGEPWRTELRNGLRHSREAAAEEDHEIRVAVEATVDRIAEHFETGIDPDGGRARIGFVEVARKEGREFWHSLQPEPPWKGVVRNSRPFVLPLIAMLDEGRARGVAVLSSERVRLLEWSLQGTGEIEEYQRAETSPGRERTAPDAERLQGSPLEAHVVRFLKDVAGSLRDRMAAHGWAELLLIGPQPLCEEVTKQLPNLDLQAIDHHDLISERTAQIGERAAERIAQLNQEREVGLVERVEAAVHAADGNGALGPQETLETLMEGRVEHLVLDADRDYTRRPLEQDLAYAAEDHGGLPLVDRLIELAYATSARVTPVEGEAAERLERHGGAAALLRF
jgi:hypothetical protein